MSEAFLTSAAHLTSHLPGGTSGGHRQEMTAAVLQTLLLKAGLPARRVAARQMAELHWLLAPGDDGAWLPQLARELGFTPGLPVFGWPSAPLLDHYLLHNAARSVQSGQRDLVIVGQFTAAGENGEPQASAALLASPAAVGRHNLAPRARIAALLALSSAPDGLVCAASTALRRLAERERASQKPPPRSPAAQDPAQPSGASQPFMNILPEMLPSGDLRTVLPVAAGEEQSEPERFDLPLPEEIAWLAGNAPAIPDHSLYFPRARWLAGPQAGGALPLLDALMVALENRTPDRQPETWGALFSSGPLENGLVTLIERT